MRFLLLLLILCYFVPVTAQVGINTTTPQQALEIDGKLALGDDTLPATEGTLRYNAQTKHFEGYDGGAWKALTNVPQVSGGAVPAGAIPVYGITPPVGSTTTDESENFTIGYAGQNGTFVTVPRNTFLVVTWVNVRDNDVNPADARILVRIRPRSGTSLQTSRGVTLVGRFPSMIWTESSLSPLVVVRAGEQLVATVSRFSEDIVNVEMRGFLVPALSY